MQINITTFRFVIPYICARAGSFFARRTANSRGTCIYFRAVTPIFASTAKKGSIGVEKAVQAVRSMDEMGKDPRFILKHIGIILLCVLNCSHEEHHSLRDDSSVP